MKKEGLDKKRVGGIFTVLLLFIAVILLVGCFIEKVNSAEASTNAAKPEFNIKDFNTYAQNLNTLTDALKKGSSEGVVSFDSFIEQIKKAESSKLLNLYNAATLEQRKSLVEFMDGKDNFDNKLKLWQSFDSDKKTADTKKKEFLDTLKGESKTDGTYDYTKIADFYNNGLSTISDKQSRIVERNLVANYVKDNEQLRRGVKGDGMLRDGKTKVPEFKMNGFGEDYVKLNSDGSFSVGKKTFNIAARIGAISNVPLFASEVTAISEDGKKGIFYNKIENYAEKDGKLIGTKTYYSIKDLSEGDMDSNRDFYDKYGNKIDGMHYAANGVSFTVTSDDKLTTFEGTASKAVSYTNAEDIKNNIFPYIQHGDSIVTVADGQTSFKYSVDAKGNIISSNNVGLIVMREGYGESLNKYYNSEKSLEELNYYNGINDNPHTFVGLKKSNAAVYDGTTPAENSQGYVQLVRTGQTENGNGILKVGININSLKDVYVADYLDQKIDKLNVVNSEVGVYGYTSKDGKLEGIQTLSINNEKISVNRVAGEQITTSPSEGITRYSDNSKSDVGFGIGSLTSQTQTTSTENLPLPTQKIQQETAIKDIREKTNAGPAAKSPTTANSNVETGSILPTAPLNTGETTPITTPTTSATSGSRGLNYGTATPTTTETTPITPTTTPTTTETTSTTPTATPTSSSSSSSSSSENQGVPTISSNVPLEEITPVTATKTPAPTSEVASGSLKEEIVKEGTVTFFNFDDLKKSDQSSTSCTGSSCCPGGGNCDSTKGEGWSGWDKDQFSNQVMGLVNQKYPGYTPNDGEKIVVLHTTSGCGYCNKAKNTFDTNGVKYVTVYEGGPFSGGYPQVQILDSTGKVSSKVYGYDLNGYSSGLGLKLK